MEGSLVYIPNETLAWIPATVMKVSDDGMVFTVVLQDEDGTLSKRIGQENKIREIDLRNEGMPDKLPLQNVRCGPNGCEDMCTLSYLHEPAILYNLKTRFFCSAPYTYTGDICIAINPYTWLDLYSTSLRYAYMDHGHADLPPHVYATSARAYRNMMKKSTPQSILVSGESGAGKTETVKIMMEHLATIAGESKFGQGNVIQKVLKSNPLLESFGNAKTLRNDNSSRFGKFIQLQFDHENHLVGANCRHYLLEKSRVVQQAEGERNYHIFYQLLTSSNPKLHLQQHDAQSFRYTKISGTTQIEDISDEERFQMTCDALKTIGIKDDEQMQLFSALSSILHLGEIDFGVGADDESSTPKNNNSAIVVTAELLGCTLSDLSGVLCSRTVKARNEIYSVPLSIEQAHNNKDALAKELYSRIFGWLVTRINNSIGCDCKTQNHIDLLDIFGFECFQHNTFEQFCINYANEKLQQRFTLDVLKSVQQEYMAEGIPWEKVLFKDNQDMLDLIEGKMGLIALLNEECVRPKGSDLSFASKVTFTHEENPYFEKTRLNQTQFMLRHYAGSIVYECDGFVEKNKDTLQSDLVDLLGNTCNPLIESLFSSSSNSHKQKKSPSSLQNGRKGSNMMSETVSSKFKVQLSSLMVDISATEVHYIRSIKPNGMKRKDLFDEVSVVDQLRCAGVIEAIRITRASYPNKLPHEEFLQKYVLLRTKSSKIKNEKASDACEALASILFAHRKDVYTLGKTNIYFRRGALEELEDQTIRILNSHAGLIQKYARRWIQGREYVKLRKMAITIQNLYRRRVGYRKYMRIRRATVIIQSMWRGKLGRRTKEIKIAYNAATKIQSFYSMILSRKKFMDIKNATIRIQSMVKMQTQVPKYRIRLAEKKEQDKMETQLLMLKQRLDEECLARQQIEARNTSLQQQLAAARSSIVLEPVHASNHWNTEDDDKKLLNESGKMLEYMRGEMNKLREQNERLRMDNENLKAENKRVKEAYTAAGASFAALNQHNKQQSKANLRLMSTHAALIKSQEEKMKKYQKQSNDLKEELRMQRNVYSAELMQRVQQQDIIMNIVRLAESHGVDVKVVDAMRALVIDSPAAPKPLTSSSSIIRQDTPHISENSLRESSFTSERQNGRYIYDRERHSMRLSSKDVYSPSKDVMDPAPRDRTVARERSGPRDRLSARDSRDSFLGSRQSIYDEDRRKSKIGGMLKKMFTGKDV